MNHILTIWFTCYMGAAVFSYVALMLLSFRADRKYQQGFIMRNLRVWGLTKGINAPAVTVLAPAKNEEKIISESIKAFLGLPYPNLQLLIVDDGSTDGTFDVMQQEYKLEMVPVQHWREDFKHKPITSVWQSPVEPRLKVVRKVASGGSKGDANNAGLEVVTTPLVFVTDVDSVVEPTAIAFMIARMEETRTVAVGCPLRLLNGCDVKLGVMQRVGLPSSYWDMAQVAEYARAFQLRQGWASLGMLNNISGAAGLFKITALRQIGGYRPDTTAEDLASTFGFHLHNLPIALEPSVNVYTQVPETKRSLKSQRKRWARGLFDILWDTRRMLNPRHGRFTFLALWLWVFELIEPFVETLGLCFIVVKIALYGMPLWGWLTLLAGILITLALSIASVIQRERLFPRFSKSDGRKVSALAILEIFPFKIPLALFWRITGTFEYLAGNTTWEALPRQNFAKVKA